MLEINEADNSLVSINWLHCKQKTVKMKRDVLGQACAEFCLSTVFNCLELIELVKPCGVNTLG